MASALSKSAGVPRGLVGGGRVSTAERGLRAVSGGAEQLRAGLATYTEPSAELGCGAFLKSQ